VSPPPNINLFPIALINNTHGLKGYVKLTFNKNLDFSLITNLKIVYINNLSYTVELLTKTPKGALLKIYGINSVESAVLLKGKTLCLGLETIPETEMLSERLLGFKVYDSQDQFLGTVEDIIYTGANDVLAVRASNPDKDELLIPLIDEYLLKTDCAKQLIVVKKPEYA